MLKCNSMTPGDYLPFPCALPGSGLFLSETTNTLLCWWKLIILMSEPLHGSGLGASSVYNLWQWPRFLFSHKSSLFVVNGRSSLFSTLLFCDLRWKIRWKYLIRVFISPSLEDCIATMPRNANSHLSTLPVAGHFFHSAVYSDLMNLCLIPNTHLIRNNVIHVSHMFLMKLNLEECGLWWEAAMICEVCVVEGQQGDGSLQGIFPSAQPGCSQPAYLQWVLPPFFFHSFTPTYFAMCFKCACVCLFPCLCTGMHACSICSWQLQCIWPNIYTFPRLSGQA